MIIVDKIRDEKLQCDVIREAAKISALLSGKTDKYEYLTGEEMLPSGQTRVIEQAKFIYSPLEKALEKLESEDHGKQLIKSNLLLKIWKYILLKEKEMHDKVVAERNIKNKIFEK